QNPLGFRPLVRRLDGCRVWTLTPRGFGSRAPADWRLQSMAARVADALLALDARGECVLGGSSFRGLGAHSLAAALGERGGHVRLLALLDNLGPGGRAPSPSLTTRIANRWRRIPTATLRRLRESYLSMTAGIVRRHGHAQAEEFLARAAHLQRHFS